MLEEDAGLSMLLVSDVLMDVGVERLASEDVEGAMVGEAEGGLLIGERRESMLIERYIVCV